MQEKISAAHTRRSGQTARGVMGGVHLELACRVGVQQVTRQPSVFDDHCAARGQAFGVEGRGAVAARAGGQHHQIVVDESDVFRGDLFAELAGQKGCAAPDGVARDGLEERAHQRTRDLARKDDRHLLRLHASCAQALQRAPRGLFADLFRRVEVGQTTRARTPSVALHLAVNVCGQRCRAHARVACAVAARKTARVGHGLCAGRGLEASAIGVRNARIEAERRSFGSSRPLNAFGIWQGIDIVEEEFLIALGCAEFAGLGQSVEGVFFGDVGERECARNQ